MKRLQIAALFCALALCSCATLHERDRGLLQQHGVGGALYDRMIHEEPISVADIVELSHRGLPVPFILHYLQSTYYVYNLTSDDVVHLKRAGVAREVIDYLLSTPGRYAPNAWYPFDSPYYYSPYAYPYGPYPYGYGYGVGFGYPGFYGGPGWHRHW